MKKQFKEFKPTSWAIDNKTSIYVLAIILAIYGLFSYYTIPKEQIPEIVIPYVMVTTVYPGTSPSDMENFITRPLEKNIKSLDGVKVITSNSVQDFSTIMVEFNTDVEIAEAKQRVKDAVDKTKAELPNDLPADPSVMELDFSEFPIMYVNLAGDYNLIKLKEYADQMVDQIETVPEITRVDIVGALDREIQVDIDMYKMQAAMVAFWDVQNAIADENLTISGGSINMDGMSRTVRIVGEFTDIDVIRNISFTSLSGAQVRLSDIALINDSHKKVESYARLNGKNVITLNVVKKSGSNLISAADQIKAIVDEMRANELPEDLDINISGDQSYYTRIVLKELNNTIIIGFILVTIVLMFFMGLTNAIFVGLSVPLSMALAYIVLPAFDFTLNMLVMFSFIFALGIVVDDAIVVIENTFRIFTKNKMDIVSAAKAAAGEVFVPILSGTLTTLAPFVPLAFWPGVVGKFMYYIPITLIITLFASLIVAYLFNPIFAISFMKKEHKEDSRNRRSIIKNSLFIFIISSVFYLPGFTYHKVFTGIANFGIFIGISYLLHNLYMYRILLRFRHYVLPRMLTFYEKLLRWALKGRRPVRLIWQLNLLLVLSVVLFAIRQPKVLFFPDNDPTNIFVGIKLPVGTDIEVTDSVTQIVENRVFKILGESNPIVESVISNVALGASDEMFDAGTITSNRGRITISFVEFAKRHGEKTQPYLDRIRSEVKDIPGAEITVEKENMGPPVGSPISIEISGENLDELILTVERFINHVDSIDVGGIEELKSNFAGNTPELIIDIDRQRANREGITTRQIGDEIRTAILGVEASKYREAEDQYPIQLRLDEAYRENIDRLMNLKISFMGSNGIKNIPLSSVATVKYQNSYGGINRKDLKRVITVSSNLLSGYTSNEVNQRLRDIIRNFDKPEGIELEITGEQQDQEENMIFLSKAMFIALFIVLFIMITQFNSISKPFIIISEVFFSIIGVLLGYSIFGMDMSIIMTGMGIVALAGIVVRNGILLVEVTDVLIDKGVRTREAIIEAGKIRITPIVLTAASTILGLIPLAIGFNINFSTLLTEFNPQIHFGGDTRAFFGPLAWTIIFGLTFATLLTLVFIPVMYSVLHVMKIRIKRSVFKRKLKTQNTY